MTNVLASDTQRVFDEIIKRNNWDGFPPPPDDGDNGRGGGGGDGESRWSWWLRRIGRIMNRVYNISLFTMLAVLLIKITLEALGIIPNHP